MRASGVGGGGGAGTGVDAPLFFPFPFTTTGFATGAWGTSVVVVPPSSSGFPRRRSHCALTRKAIRSLFRESSAVSSAGGRREGLVACWGKGRRRGLEGVDGGGPVGEAGAG